LITYFNVGYNNELSKEEQDNLFKRIEEHCKDKKLDENKIDIRFHPENKPARLVKQTVE